MESWDPPRNKGKLTLIGLILCSVGGCLLSRWGGVLFMWTISSCLFSITLLGIGLIESAVFVDPISSPVLSISILVTALTIMVVAINCCHENWNFLLLSSSVSIVEVFLLTNSFILLFVSFELTLVPMFLLITWWGSNPERILASNYIMLYTIVASAPLFLVILQVHSLGVSVNGPSFLHIPSHVISIFGVFAFLVKVPTFLTHSWLPRAHVEAPLEGSILLAGVMLKVGVYGFIRMMMTLSLEESKWVSSVLTPLTLFGSIYAMVAALSSDDLNVSVAYSSVAHMNLCLAGLCTFSLEGLGGSILSMVSHGLISPILFYNVTLLYTFSHSRSVLINNGVFGNIPQLNALSLLVWSVNLGIPPFLSFLGEVKVLGSIVCSYILGGAFSTLFIVASSTYIVINYGILNHSGSSSAVKGSAHIYSFLLSGTVVVVTSFLLFFSSCLFSISKYT